MPAGTLEKRVGCAVAALLHFRVFLGAVYTIKAGCIELDRESGVEVMGMLSRRVCEAYVFDLCLIWFRGIMPFSRVRRGSAIVQHHLPALVIVSLGFPYLLGMDRWERSLGWASSHSYILRCDGVAFLSSLNECLMSLQNVHAWFSHRHLQTAELGWKVLIFTLFAATSVLGCLHFDVMLWADFGHGASDPTGPLGVVDKVGMLFKSAIAWRTCAWAIFVAVHYPGLAKRAMRRFAEHWTGRSRADSEALEQAGAAGKKSQ